jgi:hypothetical protein
MSEKQNENEEKNRVFLIAFALTLTLFFGRGGRTVVEPDFILKI